MSSFSERYYSRGKPPLSREEFCKTWSNAILGVEPMRKVNEKGCGNVLHQGKYIKAIQIVGKTKFFDGLGWMFVNTMWEIVRRYQLRKTAKI